MSMQVAADALERIARLKRERGAAVLAHYYCAPEVQAVADHVGDSFALAKLAVSLPENTLVIAGVSFMGESMKLLNPDKRVLMPAPDADCPMAHMATRATVEAAREEYGDDLAVACYVNSTVEMKSWSDVCVTSSNAVAVVRALPQNHVMFIPDRNLGRYVAEQVPEKHVILNDGCCPYHARISAKQVEALKAAHPEAPVLAHPECCQEVLEQADLVGSTAEIIAYAEKSSAPAFIVVTMEGVGAEIARRCHEERPLYFVDDSLCPEMAKITLDGIVSCLEQGTGEVTLPDGDICGRAARALEQMLVYAKR